MPSSTLGRHPTPGGNVFHDRLLSSAALAPRGVKRRSRSHTPPCRVRQHYDVTIASRSFRIVQLVQIARSRLRAARRPARTASFCLTLTHPR
jgi:hypothetical protein